MNDEQFEKVLSRVQNNKSEATADQYIPKIREFREWLDEKPMEEADVIDIEDWLGHLDERYNNASSVGKGEAALVAAFEELNKLIRAGRIAADEFGHRTPADLADYTPDDTSTFKSRETKEDVAYLKPEEVDDLAEATDKLRDELIVRLLFQTGIRVTELCNIRWPEDVDTEARGIKIRGKGRKNRRVGYQPSLDLLMDVWTEERRPAVYYAEDSEYLFPTSHSEQIRRQTVEEAVRKAAEDAGLQSTYGETADGVTLHTVTPHVLRHSFAMEALSSPNKWDIYTLSAALGHEDTETTASTYLHDDPDEVRKAFRNRGPST